MIASEVITDAYRKIGYVADDETATADQVQAGLRALRRFLRSIQNRAPDLFITGASTITLTTAASYSLAGARKVHSVRLRRNGIDTPMQQMTRQEYDALPLKTSTGLPTTWHYDRQSGDSGTLYVWPVLATAAGETLRITLEREIDVPAGVSDIIDLPAEWEEALIFGLAERLAEPEPPAWVARRAAEELQAVMSRDHEGSVFFGDPGY